jgi:hypothetical protein
VPCKTAQGVKSELFQELEDQCYPVLKLKVEIHTFVIVGGSKADLTLKKKAFTRLWQPSGTYHSVVLLIKLLSYRIRNSLTE